jgi:carboxylesterase
MIVMISHPQAIPMPTQTASKLTNTPFLLTGTNPDHAILLLHGLGGGVYEMQLLGEYLHQLGFTVQGIAYPGHDQPEPKMPASTWQEWYEHVLKTYQQLSNLYPNITVVGFSTGCPLALHLASQFPVHKLVLLSPYLLIRRQWYLLMPVENYIFALDWLIKDVPRLRLPIFDPEMQRQAMEVVFYRTFNIPSVRSAMELIEQVKPAISQIKTPTLIIQSPKDTVVDPSGAEYLEQHLGSPQKKLVWLQNSDHVVSLDSERNQVFAEVGAFLQR